MSGVDDLIDPRIPIIVFGGPPGTGQTYAVKGIAAKSGRIASELGKDKGRGKGVWNHAAPAPEAGDMKRQRLYPVPAGAVLPRDVRVLHGGTPNFSHEVRFLPSILLCSGAAAAAGRFKQDWPTLPRQLFDTLRSDVQELCENLIGEVGKPT